MNNFVITIARGYGSGGKTIGKMLSEKLKIGFYDDELLRLASDESGISEALFAKFDEQLESPKLIMPGRAAYTGKLIEPGRDGFTSMQNLFALEAAVIKRLAGSESAVIIGRCSDYILKGYKNVLRLYVHAPFDYCVEKTLEVHPDFTSSQAASYIKRMDKRRSDYYTYFTGESWKNADNYDLCINSSDMSWDMCVKLVREYLAIKMGE